MSKHKEADAAINNTAFFSSLVGNQIHDSHNVINNDVLFVEPNKEYQFYCSDCTKPEVSIGYVHDNKKHLEYENPEFTYKFNNHRFRCDDFSSEDASNNFLFVGCSHTFGVGMPYEQTWAYQLNKNLNGEKFFNVSIAGGSYQQIISDTYKYIYLFGKPKAIFMLLPNLERFNYLTINKGLGGILESIHWGERHNGYKKPLVQQLYNYDTVLYNFFNTIIMFEMYCQSAGIKLYWSTWDLSLQEYIKQIKEKYLNNDIILNSFIFWSSSAYSGKVREGFSKKYKDTARDHDHFGGIAHQFFHDLFLRKMDK